MHDEINVLGFTQERSIHLAGATHQELPMVHTYVMPHHRPPSENPTSKQECVMHHVDSYLRMRAIKKQAGTRDAQPCCEPLQLC
jgi:hypothetical protein